MASTPPLQITVTPRTPPTPLHGALYDHGSPRRTSARLRQKRALEEEPTSQSNKRASRPTNTPSTPRVLNFEPRSPESTPQRRITGRRVQIMSPTSPDSDAFAPKPIKHRSSNNQPLLSASTTLNEGMLPTPVKTPNKKQKIINKSNIAARALFQDQLGSEEMALSPRRNRTKKRFNGFSLESVNSDRGQGQNGVQIFTDSRDQIPEAVQDDGNPFLDDRKGATATKVAGTSKKRKVSQSTRMDPQVEESFQDDEGMVYVFRGKKVYRRFDDTGEEEEEIDANELGLLEYANEGERTVRPLKTLTRKSIKPTRLFQTEAQKRARELEKEEEATTDIEETVPEEPERAEDAIRASRSKGKSTDVHNDAPAQATNKTGGKKLSPFNSWARVKPGSAASSSATKPTRSRKRAASESFEEQPVTKA